MHNAYHRLCNPTIQSTTAAGLISWRKLLQGSRGGIKALQHLTGVGRVSPLSRVDRRTCAITSATYRMVPGGTAPRRLNVNGIKTATPTSAGNTITAARSPSSVTPTGDGGSCFTLSPTSTRTLPCRAAVPPPPPPKPSWPTASRLHVVKEDSRGENEQQAAASHGGQRRHTQSERSTLLEDGGVMSTLQSAPPTTWDQSAALMPMLPEETTTDDVIDTRPTSTSSAGTGCSGGVVSGKLAMFFLVGIPVIGVVAAALAWFYSCRQVSVSASK